MNQVISLLYYLAGVLAVVALLLALPAWAFAGWLRQVCRATNKGDYARRQQRSCRRCHGDLTGLAQIGTCPECGRRYAPREEAQSPRPDVEAESAKLRGHACARPILEDDL